MAKGNTVRLWRRSLIVLMVMLIAGFGLLIFRLVQLQIVEARNPAEGSGEPAAEGYHDQR